MADNLSSEDRRKNMSHIRSKNSKPEELVRKYLFAHGFRYRKNVAKLPGKPDIVLSKYHSVVFVNGCFWHRHEGCRYASLPKTNTEFWVSKFEYNAANDKRHKEQLECEGWRVIVIWECEIKTQSKFQHRMDELILNLHKLNSKER